MFSGGLHYNRALSRVLRQGGRTEKGREGERMEKRKKKGRRKKADERITIGWTERDQIR